MRVHSVLGNSQRLDGGSMFGNCPRTVWERWSPPDRLHRIALACRALLVRESGGRTILFEAGIGAFFSPELAERYGVQERQHVLLESLFAIGVVPADIDIVVLSHLHFDHAGGILTAHVEGQPPALIFPRAHYVVGEEAWRRAEHPHARDRASFIPELIPLLQTTGRLELVSGSVSEVLGAGYTFTFSEGHTPGLMLTTVDSPRGPVTFLGDLVPGVPWVHAPITMGYDRYPERLIEEKIACLEAIRASGGWAFFTHDPDVAVCKITRDPKGRFGVEGPLQQINW